MQKSDKDGLFNDTTLPPHDICKFDLIEAIQQKDVNKIDEILEYSKKHNITKSYFIDDKTLKNAFLTQNANIIAKGRDVIETNMVAYFKDDELSDRTIFTKDIIVNFLFNESIDHIKCLDAFFSHKISMTNEIKYTFKIF